MSFKKNLRGAETYATPATPTYRDNYDRIFGKKAEEPAPPACTHVWQALGSEPQTPSVNKFGKCVRCDAQVEQ